MAPFSGIAPFPSIIIHVCTCGKQIVGKNLNHYDHYCCLNHTRRPHFHPHGIHSSHALRAARIHHKKKKTLYKSSLRVADPRALHFHTLKECVGQSCEGTLDYKVP